jgi:hypothetical protein
MPNLRYSDGRPLHLGRIIGQGGEAVVHEIAAENKKQCVRIPHDPNSAQWDKTESMIGRPPRCQRGRFAWPIDIVWDQGTGKPVGVIMDRLKGQLFLVAVSQHMSRRRRLRIVLKLPDAFAQVHMMGAVNGDVNSANILIHKKQIAILDVDSFQWPKPSGGFWRCNVGHPDYTPPELVGKKLSRVNRTPQHDYFGSAVLIYQLLIGDGSHPFECHFTGSGDKPPRHERIRDGLWPYREGGAGDCEPRPNSNYEKLPDEVRAFFQRCFDAGHSDPSCRPSPQEWKSMLMRIRPSDLPRSANESTACSDLLMRVVQYVNSIRENTLPSLKKGWKDFNVWLRRSPMNAYRFVGGTVAVLGVAGAITGYLMLNIPRPQEAQDDGPSPVSTEQSVVLVPPVEEVEVVPEPVGLEYVEPLAVQVPLPSEEPRSMDYGGEETPLLIRELIIIADHSKQE